jgi:hypothetical protein
MPTPALFAEEFDFLKHVPGALWTHETEYPPFHTDEFHPLRRLAAGIGETSNSIQKSPLDANLHGILLPDTDLYAVERTSAIDCLSKAARSDTSFMDAIWRHLGINLEELWADDHYHAFFASTTTPWGIYLMPEK